MLVKGDGGRVEVEWSQKQTGTQTNPVLPETHHATPSEGGRFPGTSLLKDCYSSPRKHTHLSYLWYVVLGLLWIPSWCPDWTEEELQVILAKAVGQDVPLMLSQGVNVDDGSRDNPQLFICRCQSNKKRYYNRKLGNINTAIQTIMTPLRNEEQWR